MKVINPKYSDPVKQFAAAVAPDVEAYLNQNAEKQSIDFEQIKADFATVKDPRSGTAPMTEGTIAAIFQYLGYEVIE